MQATTLDRKAIEQDINIVGIDSAAQCEFISVDTRGPRLGFCQANSRSGDDFLKNLLCVRHENRRRIGEFEGDNALIEIAAANDNAHAFEFGKELGEVVDLGLSQE